MNSSSRRGMTIGASVAAVVVLLAAIAVFIASRGDDGGDVVESTTTTSSTTTSTTSTSTTSTTSTTVPVAGVADAGDDIDVTVGATVELAARGLEAGTADAAVVWTQTSGPDVTAGAGVLTGPVQSFAAPTEVTTIAFELSVAGVDGTVTDEVAVRVFEDAEETVFVDGERGDDGGGGTRESPYRTLLRGVDDANGRDVYVRSVGIYDTSAATLVLDPTTSVYGGYDEQWLRNVSARANVKTAHVGLRYVDATTVTLSALDVVSLDAPMGSYAVSLEVNGATEVSFVDSRIVAGSGGDGVEGQPGQWSAGMSLVDVDAVAISRSTVSAGRSGSGGAGAGPPSVEATPSSAGADATAEAAGVGGRGSGTPPSLIGGAGGAGGVSGNGQAGAVAQGAPAAGGTSGRRDGGPGVGGGGGVGGTGGSGGIGLVDPIDGTVVSTGAPGEPGDSGLTGTGGNGGGGGFGSSAGRGGGGGGGGSGGQGAIGGQGGAGGGASVGVVAFQVGRIRILESLISGSTAGAGGVGSTAPATSTSGGGGGRGAAPTCVPSPCAGADTPGTGGGGGAGGSGGAGGQAGGGAGGPSIGLLTASVDTVEVRSSTLRGGGGGTGADGGAGGRYGANGSNASGSAGAPPAERVGERIAESGVGASGGSSYGWFDDGRSGEVLDAEIFESGVPGTGGQGSEPGPSGSAEPTNR